MKCNAASLGFNDPAIREGCGGLRHGNRQVSIGVRDNREQR